MENNLYFLRLDKKLIFSDENGKINPNLSMNFELALKNNIIIDLFEIMAYISKNTDQLKNKKLSIYYKNEKNIIVIKELDVEYTLDNLLIEFFEKLKEKMITENTYIKKLLIVLDDNFTYELKLIIQQVALIKGIEIMNMIDTNKALSYYIISNNKIPKLSKTKHISIITKYNKNIQIAIYMYNPIRKLFNIFQEIPKIFEDLQMVKVTNGFILLDEFNGNELFKKLKEYISDLIAIEMGKQKFQNIEQIYIFEYDNNPNLTEQIFLGTSYSLNIAKTQECKAIFKRKDKNEDEEDIYNEITINEYHYYLNKNELPILLEIESPFEGCFYTTIELILYQNMIKNKIFLITVYFNQINYYYISLNIISSCNSIEFLFYKTIPDTIFNSMEYKSILYEEKFEEKEIFKRLCLINVDSKIIQQNLFPNELLDEIDEDYKNITVVFGEKLNIFSFFKKELCRNKDLKRNIYEYIKFIENLNSKTTLEYIKLHQNELNEMYFKKKNLL